MMSSLVDARKPNSAEIAPPVHHDDAMGDAEAFGHLGGREHHGQPLRGALGQQAEHLGLGADVDAPARLVEQDHACGWVVMHLADHHLLLVAARERPDRPRPPPVVLMWTLADRVIDHRCVRASGTEAFAWRTSRCWRGTDFRPPTSSERDRRAGGPPAPAQDRRPIRSAMLTAARCRSPSSQTCGRRSWAGARRCIRAVRCVRPPSAHRCRRSPPPGPSSDR